MSFQSPGGGFPGQPTGAGGFPGGPGYPPGMYHPRAGPPAGMYVPGSPVGVMNTFPGMRPMGQPGILPMPGFPPVMLQMQPPMRGPIITASPQQFSPARSNIQARIPVISPSAMKVATTVFVGNISEKSSDTLLRQILLRCGRIEGWKRVQDASGKLQGFGFCEYGDPESTLRALRILHDFKLGEKNLVVKVDSKTRIDLLKYVLKKTKQAAKEPVDEAELLKEAELMDEKKGTEVLKQVTDDAQKEIDGQIIAAITALVKENVDVLGDDSSRSAADVQLEKDVKEALFAIAKQKGKIDPNCTLDDMDMEDDMKTLVSGEIKKFRLSSEQQLGDKHKQRDRDKKKTTDNTSERARSPSGEKEERGGDGAKEREGRTRSPPRRERSPRARSPPKSPRTKARERQEREATRKEKEREESLREEESYWTRQLQRKQRTREKAYKDRLITWESRERRRTKDYDKDYEKEEKRKEEMEKEGKDLGEFLEDYDDEKDDQRYYKGSQFARRRRERELERDEDERDRQREKQEIEALKLEVMERQIMESKRMEAAAEEGVGSTGSSSPQRADEEDEDVDLPSVMEMEEDIPLAKTGFNPVPAYPPIQVQSAPSVDLKSHPHDSADRDGITIPSSPAHSRGQKVVDGFTDEEEMDIDSPQASGVKMSFGVRSKQTGAGGGGSNGTPLGKRPAIESNVLGPEEEGELDAPKKKLASIRQIEREQRDERRGALEREVSQMAARYGAEDRQRIPSDEKKRMVQTLVKGIPTTKEELFEYELKWDAIDQNLMDKRIGPWINKKIVEYIGEEELTLTDFICNKLSTHIPAATILEELAMVLDEEAEVFVVKLWRLLIYETEAKRLGIAKSY